MQRESDRQQPLRLLPAKDLRTGMEAGGSMRKTFIPVPIVLAFLAIFQGCAANPAKVTIGKETYQSTPVLEPVKSNTTGEPELVFCVDGSKQSLDRFLLHAPFRNITLADPRLPCDVILRIHWEYSNGSGSVVATSAENGSDLLRAEAEGVWGPVFGVERLGPIVYNAFVPGSPLYRQVTDAKKADEAAFQESARRYRELPVKPALPEEARKYQVQAEAAVKRKNFTEASDRYGDALKVAPWWPEGHFNRALILGEMGRYRNAIDEMKKYLAIVPNAPDARAAQDKIYEWEGLAGNPDKIHEGEGLAEKPAGTRRH
jgi:hypothetical protein